MSLSDLPVVQLVGGGSAFITGCRIPKSYFVTSGFGETDSGGGTDPYETGSYDIALEEAGIQDFNIMTYTSVMPPESHEISRNEAQLHYSHGAVLEVIMSQINGNQGDRLSVGVARNQVRRKDDGTMIGGYAAEYKGHAKAEDVKAVLTRDLEEIFARRYSEDEYEMLPPKYTILEKEVTKAYGTALACIAFTSYLNPIVPIAGEDDDKTAMKTNGQGGTKLGKQKQKDMAEADTVSPRKKGRK